MKIAFPTQFDHGLESPVFGHFGSAGYFLVVDDASGAVETIVNADRDHLHGQCQPLAALGGNKVDAVVVGGIGGGALQKLLSSNQTETPRCKTCGGVHLKKMLSAPSPLSGVQTHRLPGRGDSPCCGTTPSQVGCAGPGSCCGKAGR